MTITTKTFQNIQTGIKDADDLRVRGPVNNMMQWLGSGLPAELNAQFTSLSTSIADLNTRVTALSSSVSVINVALGQISQSTSVQIAAYAAARPAFLAHKNGTDQLSISATATPVTFGTEDFDVGSRFAANTWTPPAGKHRLTVHLTFLGTNGVDNEALTVALLKNGAAHRQGIMRRPGTASFTAELSCVADANGTDAFTVTAAKSGAGIGTIDGTATNTFFCGEAIA
jgi:hypothetical protein